MTELGLPDLCVPKPGSTTLRTVVSGALRRTLADLTAVLQEHADGPWGADVREFWRRVAPLARTAAGALPAAVRRTEVAVWIRCLRPSSSQPVDPSVGVPALLCTMALQLVRSGALTEPLCLRAWPERIVDGVGRLSLVVPPGTHTLRFDGDGVTALGPAGPVALSLKPDDAAFVSLADSDIRLALVDTSPVSALEAHPDKAGNTLDLGGQPVSRWQASLEAALRTIGEHLPAMRAELEVIVQHFVPVGYDAERHLSASIVEAIGTVYLSLHPNPMTMVEAVLHEASHNKLAALFELDPVLDNPIGQTHVSAVRPDPRPLRGILLAVHAFMPVAALYRAMIESGAPGCRHPQMLRRHDEIIRGNYEGMAVLREHARPTALGRQLLDELDALDREFGPS